jgi:alpha-beta hydrolase superfamily lysophospholipase
MKRSDPGPGDTIREMVLASPHLTKLAGGAEEVAAILEAIDDEWLEVGGRRVHLDVHPAHPGAAPKATIVFQPGSGAHARNYFLLGGLLARRGYEVLAIDRFGHGLSDGERGDCTVEEALEIAGSVIELARSRAERPVVLMGSSMGGLLTIFGLLAGLKPDLAVAHNFLFPGKLFSLRLRARWIARFRTKPYALTELVHGFEALSADPAVAAYLREHSDPYMAWELSPRSVASLFGFWAAGIREAPDTLVLTGDRDKAIPAWATRLFTRWFAPPSAEVKVIPDAGHLLFHEHLDASVPIVADWLDARVVGLGGRRDGKVDGVAPSQ